MRTTLMILILATATLASGFTVFLQPYNELESMYNKISSINDYRTKLLRAPFQNNILYLVYMAQINDFTKRMSQIYRDFWKNIEIVKTLKNEKPSFTNVFNMVSAEQRAKVDLALIKNMYAQLTSLVNQMIKEQPAVSCRGDEIDLVKEVLNVKSIGELLNMEKKIKERGGADLVAKCVFKLEINKMYNKYMEFKKWFDTELQKMSNIIQHYDELISLLVPGG